MRPTTKNVKNTCAREYTGLQGPSKEVEDVFETRDGASTTGRIFPECRGRSSEVQLEVARMKLFSLIGLGEKGRGFQPYVQQLCSLLVQDILRERTRQCDGSRDSNSYISVHFPVRCLATASSESAWSDNGDDG